MSAFWSALVGVWSRWKYVEEEDGRAETASRRKSSETPQEEIARLRQTIVRERKNLKEYQRFECSALAGPCESSIRAMESRIHALELRKAI